MFKQRLKVTIGVILLIAGVLAGSYFGVNGLWWLQDNWTMPESWKMGIMWVMLAILAGLFVKLLWELGRGIIWFVKWLFLEPYQNRKRGK